MPIDEEEEVPFDRVEGRTEVEDSRNIGQFVIDANSAEFRWDKTFVEVGQIFWKDDKICDTVEVSARVGVPHIFRGLV